MTRDYQHQDIQNLIHQEWMNDVQSVLLFLGHAHSGHSIIGAMIDAHHEAAVANEVNIIKSVRDHHLNKEQVLNLLYDASLGNRSVKQWKNSEYRYNFSDTEQGLTQYPKVLGDKKAGGTTQIIAHSEWALTHLFDILGDKLKFIFVDRNPVDIVAAYSYYMKQDPCQFHIDRYIENLKTTENVKTMVDNSQWLHIKQDIFIQQPEDTLSVIFNFLNLSINAELISYLAGFVKKDIKPKSDLIQIPKKLISQLTPYLS